MQRLIKICRGLPPFGGVEGEDRVDGHVRDRGGMGVPWIEPCSRDNAGQPGGLLGAAQWGNGEVIQKFKAAEEIICFLAAYLGRGHGCRMTRLDETFSVGGEVGIHGDGEARLPVTHTQIIPEYDPPAGRRANSSSTAQPPVTRLAAEECVPSGLWRGIGSLLLAFGRH
jgi:hypothetical protein